MPLRRSVPGVRGSPCEVLDEEKQAVIHDALKRTGANPEIVTDNGSQFRAQDFKELVRDFELEHIRIRTYHPESNGRIERFHRTTREELGEVELGNLCKAREIIGRWVAFYNQKRLHAGLKYLTPEDCWEVEPEKRPEERREKLARGDQPSSASGSGLSPGQGVTFKNRRVVRKVLTRDSFQAARGSAGGRLAPASRKAP